MILSQNYALYYLRISEWFWCKHRDKAAEWSPNEEFELTANSLEAHIETHGGLILHTRL